MLGKKFNMDDAFFRDLTVCVLDKLEGQIKWVNRFSSGDYPVNVPFYYSLTGDDRFLLDTFSDDIVSENRFVELNTDQIPRAHITLTNFNINADEFANPNVWLRLVVENEVEIRKVLAKIRAIPITVSYDVQITLASEIDIFKCSQAIMDTIWLYQFMYFEHNFMNIDAVMTIPDTTNIQISREKDLTSDNSIKMIFAIEVNTYYPAYRKDRGDVKGYQVDPRLYGNSELTNMTDSNGHIIQGGFSEYFNSPYDYIGGFRDENGNLSNVNIKQEDNKFSDKTNFPFGSSPEEGYIQYAPKRTKWFNNILKARERSRNPISNPNSEKFPKK
jgi:hypothetical protein